MTRVYLNGDDWTVAGFWVNQWRLPSSIELAADQNPAIPPIKAEVPGAVNLDLIRAGLVSDPNIDLNSQEGEWVSNRDWIYFKEFIVPEDLLGKTRYYLHFAGLDYHGEIRLNGQKIQDFSGMFIPLHIDITDHLNMRGKNKLQVIFYQPPEVDGQFGYTSQIKHLKSRFNYKWDWCARIIPVGIWDDVYLEAVEALEIVDFYPRAVLKEDNQTGTIQINLRVNNPENKPYQLKTQVKYMDKTLGQWEWTQLTDSKLSREINLNKVKPWWPVGYGEQPLYQVKVSIINNQGRLEQSLEKNVGFKRFYFTANQNAPADALPYTLIFNGKRIFLQGINWVPISPFYGAVGLNDYQNHLARFKSMNCNIIRVWGGAILEKEEFYQTCDELGLLVWQEFFQSSSGIDNCPSDDPEFMDKLKQAASSAIKRRRHHVSQIIWCGGNELFLNGVKDPVDIDHPNIRMLSELVNELDPDKQFYPASPSGPTFQVEADNIGKKVHHDVHGPWQYLGDGLHNQFYNQDDSLLRSETGTPGTNGERTLRKIASRLPAWPPNKSNLLWKHHGDWWIQWQQLTGLFGPWSEEEDQLGEYVRSSQYLQAESLRYAVEATQRRQPVSSGIIIWMGNEPYANTANTSLIEYNGLTKPVYGWLKRSFGPLNLSCKYDKIAYQVGELFETEIYLHDSLNQLSQAFIKAELSRLDGTRLVEKDWQWERPENNNNVWSIGTLDWKVTDLKESVFLLRLKVKGQDEIKVVDTYLFTVNQQYPFAPLRKLPLIELETDFFQSGDKYLVRLKNNSDKTAVMVHLEGVRPEEFLDIAPNDISIMPGEERNLKVTSLNRKFNLSQSEGLLIQGMNVLRQKLFSNLN